MGVGYNQINSLFHWPAGKWVGYQVVHRLAGRPPRGHAEQHRSSEQRRPRALAPADSAQTHFRVPLRSPPCATGPGQLRRGACGAEHSAGPRATALGVVLLASCSQGRISHSDFLVLISKQPAAWRGSWHWCLWQRQWAWRYIRRQAVSWRICL